MGCAGAGTTWDWNAGCAGAAGAGAAGAWGCCAACCGAGAAGAAAAGAACCGAGAAGAGAELQANAAIVNKTNVIMDAFNIIISSFPVMSFIAGDILPSLCVSVGRSLSCPLACAENCVNFKPSFAKKSRARSLPYSRDATRCIRHRRRVALKWCHCGFGTNFLAALDTGVLCTIHCEHASSDSRGTRIEMLL